MQQYLDLLYQAVNEGRWQENRTGTRTLMIPGGMMQFDMSTGLFPILTTKLVNFIAVKAELLGFIRGYRSAEQFRNLGTKIWDANANDPGTAEHPNKWTTNPHRRGRDDLGRIYGVQWRRWRAPAPGISNPLTGETHTWEVDQFKNAIQALEKDPQSRRIIVTAWNPGELDQTALPPCHLLYQFIVEQETNRLHLCMYQRSCDMFLGVPFNISSYALLLALTARATGLTPGTFTHFLADVHVYENHLKQTELQLARPTLPLPMLIIQDQKGDGIDATSWLETIEPHSIQLFKYESHPAIPAPMAV